MEVVSELRMQSRGVPLCVVSDGFSRDREKALWAGVRGTPRTRVVPRLSFVQCVLSVWLGTFLFDMTFMEEIA